MFPCEGKRPLTKHGFKDAATDPRRIHMWWNRWPNANIGMPTGGRSGFFILDADRTKALEELEAKIGKLPATLTVRTPRDGVHLYFRHVEGVTNRTGDLPEGIDVRGEGGYALVPPSHGYAWENRSPVAEAPAALLELISERRSKVKPGRSTAQPIPDGEKIPEGQRNNALTSICGRLHDGTRSEAELIAELMAVRDAHCETPSTFTDAEVEGIARWTHRKKPCNPAKPPEVGQRIRELERIFWEMWGGDFGGLGGQSERDLLRAILECAERWGRITEDGEIEFDRSTHEMGLEAGITRPTVQSAAKRLRDKIGLRRDTGNREASHAGKWILPAPAQLLSTHTNCSFLEEKEERVDAVVKSSAVRVVGLETPYFRHFGPVGKGRGGVLLALEAHGPLSANRIAGLLGVSRVRDLRRRYLDPLVELGLVEYRGGVYAVHGDSRERAEAMRGIAYGGGDRKVRRKGRVARWVTTVQYVPPRSEEQREKAERRRYGEQLRRFHEHLAARTPEADEGCRALLNTWDEEREFDGPATPDGTISELSRADPGSSSRPAPVVGIESREHAALVAALRAFLRRQPHRSSEYASWLATALWSEGLLSVKPPPHRVALAREQVVAEGVAA